MTVNGWKAGLLPGLADYTNADKQSRKWLEAPTPGSVDAYKARLKALDTNDLELVRQLPAFAPMRWTSTPISETF